MVVQKDRTKLSRISKNRTVARARKLLDAVCSGLPRPQQSLGLKEIRSQMTDPNTVT